jgi:hypothetical protein
MSARKSSTSSIKKILACTNLSKDKSSSQRIFGIDFPGILHRMKITIVQQIKGIAFFTKKYGYALA